MPVSITKSPTRAKPQSTDDVLSQYPLLTAHLICESLGYLSPTASAFAILHHIQGKPFYCEWYIDAAGFNDQKVLDFGKRTIESAFRRRHKHRGYMADFHQANELVQAAIRRTQPECRFQSW